MAHERAARTQTARSAAALLPLATSVTRAKRRVGWAPVLGLEFVGQLCQLGHRPAECTGDPIYGAPRWILPAGLDMREPRCLDLGIKGDRLLFESELLAAQTDRAAERDLSIGTRWHGPRTLFDAGP